MWSFCVHPERLRRRNMTEPLNPLARFSCSEAEVCWSTCRTFCPRLTVQAPGKIRCSYSLTDLSIFQQHIWMTHVFVCKVGPYTLQSASTEQKKKKEIIMSGNYICMCRKKNYRLQEQRTIRRFCRCRMAAAAGTAAPVHQENSNCLDIREHPF